MAAPGARSTTFKGNGYSLIASWLFLRYPPRKSEETENETFIRLVRNLCGVRCALHRVGTDAPVCCRGCSDSRKGSNHYT